MFERFTERSRRVVVLAQEEARMLDHNYIGTEHLLLGLMHDGGITAQVIGTTGLTLETARAEVEAVIGRGASSPSGHIPFTPRAKKVLELALREALALKNSYIGPEHILLGLIREVDGVGAQILDRLAAPLPLLRAQVLELAAAEGTEETYEALNPEWMEAAQHRRRTRVVTAARGPLYGPLMAGAGFRDTLAALEQTLAALDQRLATIEDRLGIVVPPAESAAPTKEEQPEEAPPGEAPPEDAPPEGPPSEESAD
jgi:ATP-dependent Clp protease ATP-binding subunit ClpA